MEREFADRITEWIEEVIKISEEALGKKLEYIFGVREVGEGPKGTCRGTFRSVSSDDFKQTMISEIFNTLCNTCSAEILADLIVCFKENIEPSTELAEVKTEKVNLN
jgi:hypothetical protein